LAQRPSRAVSREQPGASSPRGKWRHAAVVIGLWAAAFGAYSNSFRAGLSFDSVVLVSRDARVHAATPQNVRLIWGEEYWYNLGVTGLYRPLTTSSFLLNYALLGGGTTPDGYHWLNFSLHAINILLVYLVALAVLGEMPIAAAAAGLWALHPASVEAVTYIAGRADLLAALGVLLGLLCHIRAGDAATARRRLPWLAALAVAAAIGIFSKENAITLPVAMLAYDVAFRLRRDTSTQRWRSLVPGYLAAAGPIAVYLILRAQVLSRTLAVTAFLDNPLVGAGVWTSRLTAVTILGRYLWLLAWPARLSADYSYRQIPLFSWHPASGNFWGAALALAVWGAILLAAIRRYRRRPPVFFFIAFFAATMAPTSNVIIRIGSIMAERFLYLPSVGFAGCLAMAIYAVCGRRHARFAAPAAAAVLCLLFAVRVYVRNRDWRDEKALWNHDAAVSDASYKTHASLAEVLWREGRDSLDRATAERERAVSIIEGLPEADQDSQQYTALAVCYRDEGEYGKSLEMLRRAESVARAQEQRMALANRSRKRLPPSELPAIYLQRGRTWRSMGQPARALEAFREGRLMRPESVFPAEMAATYEQTGEADQARIKLLEGAIADPAQSGFAAKAVELYRRADPNGCAAQASGGLNLECPAVVRDLCAAGENLVELYVASGRPAEADGVRTDTLRALGCRAAPR
jgi:tetratricopeptide (TPR) repeat protein